MSVTRSIAKALKETTEPVVVATVVRITGSSYGGVGTRMVIPQNAPPIGIVSGGCLESDLAEHAKEVQLSHVPKVVTYDTRADDDAAWGLGLGCNGLIDVLLEPLTETEARELAGILMRGLDSQEPAVLATVIEGNRLVGAHALMLGAETYTIGWDDSELLQEVRDHSDEAFAEARRGLVRQYGGVTVAFEIILPSVDLLICGSGPDVVPLVSLGRQLDWNLTVVDHRPADTAHAERFPGARLVECHDPRELARATRITRFTAAVVMSHNYARDLDYVRALLGSDAGYIGVLGPRARTERMFADMTSAGETILHGERIHSPVGLDLGGDGPERIALSIVSEVAAVISNRSAGHLRESRSPLHPAPPREAAEKT
jgi:xanthine/CO dehydrogenase XdhC/CoxF family maturation factor